MSVSGKRGSAGLRERYSKRRAVAPQAWELLPPQHTFIREIVMSMIVAARFQTFDQAALAANKLFAEGFTEDDVGRDKRRTLAAALRAQENHPPVRAAGVMLALHAPVGQEGLARRMLRESGGHDIERANGRWLDGKWEDFDPLTPPRRVETPTSA